jgi:hypothetical protein
MHSSLSIIASDIATESDGALAIILLPMRGAVIYQNWQAPPTLAEVLSIQPWTRLGIQTTIGKDSAWADRDGIAPYLTVYLRFRA